MSFSEAEDNPFSVPRAVRMSRNEPIAGLGQTVRGVLDGRRVSGLVQRVVFGLEAAMPPASAGVPG